MKLTLMRHAFGPHSTMGQLFVNDQFFCHILEDTDRDLNQDGDLEDAGEEKILKETAIPYGKYPIKLEKTGTIYETYKNPDFWRSRKQAEFAKEFVGMLMLTGIKGYARVHIHIGNYIFNTEGCLLTGTGTEMSKEPFSVTGSTLAYVKLYRALIPYLLKGEEVVLEVLKARSGEKVAPPVEVPTDQGKTKPVAAKGKGK